MPPAKTSVLFRRESYSMETHLHLNYWNCLGESMEFYRYIEFLARTDDGLQIMP